MKKIKLVICDDMQPYCHYLKRVFSKEDDIEVIGIANSAKACLELLTNIKPDILLLDVQMEKYDSGTEVIPSLLEISPFTKIIMLTVHHENALIFNSFVYGAIDYLNKSSSDSEIIDLVRKVYHNESHLSPHIAQAIIDESTKIKQQNASLLYVINTLNKLTTSEVKILHDICEGLSYKEIGKKRFVEEITIRSQISRIIKKFNVKRITEVTEIMKNLNLFDIINIEQKAQKWLDHVG